MSGRASKTWLVTGLALLLLLTLHASAATLRGQVQERGGSVEVSWTLSSSKSIPRNTELLAPDFKGFRVLSGPSISTSMNLINGRSSNERSWTYVLVPLSTGDLSIGPARVKYQGKTLSAKPMRVQASQAGQGGENGEGGLFLRAELSESDVVVGQELVLNWVLYFNAQVQSFEPPRLDRLPGFLVEELDAVTQPEIEQRQWKGRTWNTAVLGRCLLYPTRTGELAIEPATAQVTVRTQKRRRSRDPFGSFFDSPFFNTNERVTLASEPLQLKVRELPPGAPDGFSGAVGSYQLSAAPDHESLPAGEALTMTVSISGRGNVGMVPEPELLLSPDFERYDTQSEEDLRPTASGMRGRRSFKTLLVPKAPGEQRIEAVRFVYYDPQQKQYKELVQGPWSIQVSPGKTGGGGALVVGAGERVRSYGQDIRHLLAAPQHFREELQPLPTRWWWRVLLALMLLAPLASHLLAKREQDRRRNLPGERRRLALSRARRGLKRAATMNPAEQAGVVETVLLDYLADKQNLAAAGLVLGEEVQGLGTRGLDVTTVDALRELVRRLEYIRYGGGEPQALLRELEELLPRLEEAFRKLAEATPSTGGAR